jgi:Recombination endonuclease VII
MVDIHVSLALRRCTRCEKDLAFDQFAKSKTGRDGLHSYCRECQREYFKSRHIPAAPLPSRTCDYCGKEYVPAIRSQRFCRAACKQRSLYWRRNPREQRACAECGTDISDQRRDKTFCSTKCASKTLNRERPEIRLRHRLKKQYGLTIEGYQELLDSQGGVCAICGTDEIRGFGKRLAVDHCHDTNKVRGILCGNCNRGIGAFAHEPARLEAALRYLKKE